VLKGFHNETNHRDIGTFGTTTTPDMTTRPQIKDDAYPFDRNFGIMMICNYSSPEQAIEAKRKFVVEIERLNSTGNTMDLSRVVVILRTELTAQSNVPYFTLWIGNIHDATEDDVRRAFGRFGPFVPEASGLKQVAICTSGEQRCSFVNFAEYESADAAWDSCIDEAITFGPPGSDPAVANPRANFALVRELLLALEDTQYNRLSFTYAEAIVRQIELTTKSSLDTWLEMLRRLPHLFVVDAGRNICAAAPDATPPSAGPASGQPSLIQPAQGLSGELAATSLRRSLPLTPLAVSADATARTAAVSAVPAPDVAAAATAASTPAAMAAAGALLQETAVGPATAASPSECSVCKEDWGGLQKAAMVPCGHIFCVECCKQLRRRGYTCPTCRRPFSESMPVFGV
jgi:hypothetical protein